MNLNVHSYKLTGDQQRIREVDRELAIARMERDILKKAPPQKKKKCLYFIYFLKFKRISLILYPVAPSKNSSLT